MLFRSDITHGALVALSGTFGAIAADAWGFGAFIPVTLLVGVLSGLLIGFLNAKLKVNSFMVSLSLLIAYRAFVNLLLSSKSYTFPKELNFFKETWFEVVALIVLCVLVIYLFHYTRYGVYVRGIGENENAMIHAGVKVTKVKIMAFVLSGLLASLAGIFMLSRIGGTNNLVGSGFEMKVMMAMYIGGIPVEGGMKSKIYKLLIGAPTIILLENGLVLSGIDGSATQLIRGAVLIGVLWVTGFINDKFKYGLKKKPVAALETE